MARNKAVVVETALGTYTTREKLKLSRLLQVPDPFLDRQRLHVEAFGRFIDRMNIKDDEISPFFYTVAGSLMKSMSGCYPNELQRQNAFLQEVQSHGAISILPGCPIAYVELHRGGLI